MNEKTRYAGRVILILLLCCSVSALATISIEWGTMGTIYMNDGTTALPVGSIVQLIWSPDATISNPNAYDALIPDSTEVLLKQTTLSSDGAFYDATTTYVELDYSIGDTNGFVGGYVYTRVFDYLGSNGSPTNDTWFGNDASPTLISGSQHSVPAANPAWIDITNGDSFTLNDQVVVPEPTTMAIMGIGLLTLVSRRFRRK